MKTTTLSIITILILNGCSEERKTHKERLESIISKVHPSDYHKETNNHNIELKKIHIQKDSDTSDDITERIIKKSLEPREFKKIEIETTKSNYNTTNTSTEDKLREKLVKYAISKEGLSYSWGGKSCNAKTFLTNPKFDCSSLVQWVYAKIKYKKILPRRAMWQWESNLGKRFYDRSRLKKGDCIYWLTKKVNPNDTVSHVSIYIGDGKMIHAINNKNGIKITNFPTKYYTYKKVVGFKSYL